MENPEEGVRWRVGRKLKRTIYAQWGPEPSDDDMLIGMLDTSWQAAHVVEIHNFILEQGY